MKALFRRLTTNESSSWEEPMIIKLVWQQGNEILPTAMSSKEKRKGLWQIELSEWKEHLQVLMWEKNKITTLETAEKEAHLKQEGINPESLVKASLASTRTKEATWLKDLKADETSRPWKCFRSSDIQAFVEAVKDKNTLHTGEEAIVPACQILEALKETYPSSKKIELSFLKPIKINIPCFLITNKQDKRNQLYIYTSEALAVKGFCE